MSTNTIRERVLKIIRTQLGVSDEDIAREKTLEQLGGDSLDDVEIIMALEEEFEIEIHDQDAHETDGDIEKLIALIDKEVALDNA